MWADEIKMEFFAHNNRRYVFLKKTAFDEKYTLLTVIKHEVCS